MDSSDLTAAQLDRLAQDLTRQRDYLVRLRDRMTALKFPPNDPLFAELLRAHDAVSSALVVASQMRNAHALREQAPTIMERKPWSG